MLAILLCSLALTPSPALAEKATPTVQVGGLVFAHYGYDLTDGADGFNEFAASGRSLLATVDYDLLYCARGRDGRLSAALNRALARLKRPAHVTSISVPAR